MREEGCRKKGEGQVNLRGRPQRRAGLASVLVISMTLLLGVQSASAAFGINSFDGGAFDRDGVSAAIVFYFLLALILRSVHDGLN